MPKILPSMPTAERQTQVAKAQASATATAPLSNKPTAASQKPAAALRTHQIRVLRCLAAAAGPLSRSKISERVGITQTVVARALGYEDPDKRAAFEANDPCGGYPSLLTLGYCSFQELDIDGLLETAYEPTKSGFQALEVVKHIVIPPPRSSY